MTQIGINDLVVFVEDTPAVASEVSNNFTVCKNAINNVDTRTTTLESDINNKQSLLGSPQTKTANYTIANLEWVLVDSTSGAVNITLPSTGRVRITWSAGTNTATIVGTVNGATNYVIKSLNDSIDLQSIASNSWRMI